MSKRRQREKQRQEQERRRQQGAVQQLQPPPAPSLHELERRAEAIVAPPLPNGTPALAPVSAPPDADLPRLRACYERLETLRVKYEQALKELGEQKNALNDQAKAHDARRAELDTASADINRRRKECDDERTTLEVLSLELDDRARAIEAREKDADAGFIERSKQALERQAEEEEAARKRLEALRQQIASEEQKLAAQAETERQKLQEELARLEQETRARLAGEEQRLRREEEAARATLGGEEKKLEAQRQDLRERERRLDLDARLLEDKRRDIDQTAHALAAAEVESEQFHRRCAEERLERLRADLEEREAKLLEYEDRERQTTGRTVEECLRQIHELQEENERLRVENASRLDEQKAAKLRRLETAQDEWQRERSTLLHENEQLRGQVERRLVGVVQVETLQAQKEAYRVANDSLRQTLTELREEMDRTLQAARGQTIFPACSAMDADESLQKNPANAPKITGLKQLVEFLRHRMGWDPQRGKELYYSARDVRVFLGGLAMSRLHILQGISGTGKTSLPEAFARAIGAGHEVVAVQAGWRDRQDLIGHFNSFKNSFAEEAFLKALYKAQCPRYRDLPFLIVLDEMNLSRPEQYFADFLSALERAASSPPIDLLPAPATPSPRLLQDGHRLPWASNVWFVGTANQDETTVEFADKTYDRAHVMELPEQPAPFEVRKDLDLKKPIGLAALQLAFQQARGEHSDKAERASTFLREHLRGQLARDFRVGWGNRLEEHIRWFVPVVIAAGGSPGEAVDHLVATKLLRKVKDRHDVRSGDLRRLEETLQRSWGQLDKDNPPERSLEILKKEVDRLDIMRGGDGA
jgi:hypothetical protein